jgi:hypothetical protein
MTTIVNASFPARFRNLTFNITSTPRNENVRISSLDGNFVIDIKGNIYLLNEPTGDDAVITIVGGIDTFVNAKIQEAPLPYLTQRQQVAIYSILKQLSVLTDAAQLDSNDVTISEYVNSAYFNFCG